MMLLLKTSSNDDHVRCSQECPGSQIKVFLTVISESLVDNFGVLVTLKTVVQCNVI